jgi:hypothetical protein
MVLLALSAFMLAQPPSEPTKTERIIQRSYEFFRTRSPHSSVNVQEMKPPVTPPPLPRWLELERSWQTGHKCGAVGLFFMLHYHGVPTDLDTVIARTSISEAGSSLQDLKEAASRFGLKTRAVKVSPQDLANLPRPFIIHWISNDNTGKTNDHFDVVTNVDRGGVQIIDTSSCVQQYRENPAVASAFSGYALIADPYNDRLYVLLYASLWAVLIVVIVLAVLNLARGRRPGGRATALEAPTLCKGCEMLRVHTAALKKSAEITCGLYLLLVMGVDLVSHYGPSASQPALGSRFRAFSVRDKPIEITAFPVEGVATPMELDLILQSMKPTFGPDRLGWK